MVRIKGVYTIRTEGALNVFTYLIGVLSFLAVVRYIDSSFSLFFLFMQALALYFEYRRRYVISRLALNITLVLFVVLNSLRLSLADFATPLVEMLLILLAVKLIEEKKARDYMQIYTLAVFLLTGSALLSLDMLFLLMLIIQAFLLPVSIVLLTFHSQQGGMRLTNRDLRSIVSRALLIALLSIPITALVFIILPRTGFPMLNIISRAGASAGFSDHIKLGEIAGIQENTAAILRVDMKRIDPQMLYWRGIVMDHFDGVSWKSLNKDGQSQGNFVVAGARVYQTIYLEPYDNKYLFALDKPANVYYRNVAISSDLTIAARQNIDRRVRYSAVSVISDTLVQDEIDKERYLQLPDRDYRRVRDIVSELARGKNGEGIVRSFLNYLRGGGFAYSLKVLPVTPNPVEDFLLIYKYGNCEYFASSMAVMLRLAGIPARIVGGYMGGYYNEFGNYYLVTQDSAHVWVEAYIEGKGWIRLDPTPGGTAASYETGQGNTWLKIRLFIDSINYYWNAVIIGYDLERQMSVIFGVRDMIRAPFRSISSLRDLAYGLAIALSAILLLAGAFHFLSRRKPVEMRMVAEFIDRLKRRGHTRMPYEGLEEFALRIEDPLLRDKATSFAVQFGAVYYRDRKFTSEELASLERLLDEIGQHRGPAGHTL